MTQDEIRMRCIEAIAGSGVREVSRLIRDADVLAAWVGEAADKPVAPLDRKGKAADKGSAPA